MCGIVGQLQGPTGRALEPARAERAVDALDHRGPDARGVWTDPAHGIWLGHRRLAVIDLTSGGAQPMHSQCGRYALVYNGEIYNFGELRAALVRKGVSWRGHSDTEVLLESIAREGLDATLARVNGMFAFALWDGARRELHLARDRLGEKPLYYGLQDGNFVFASELKAIVTLTGAVPVLDRAALANYFRRNYVPESACIFADLHKLPAAHVLTIACGALPALPAPRPYWSLQAVAAAGAHAAFACSDEEAIELVHGALAQAVRARMIADVPLGALLSGGIDSSLLVALMQAASSQPVRTFSIGFAERGYDEAPHARAVAAHLGTVHTEHLVTPEEARAVIPRLPQIYDEPFADSSQIPSVLVAALARRDVTTAITGDGGDEVFAGYPRYGTALTVWRRLRALPAPLRAGITGAIERVAPPQWDRLFHAVAPLLPRRWQVAAPGDRLHKLARMAKATTPAAMHASAATLGYDGDLVIGARAATAGAAAVAGLDEVSLMMLQDTLHYLPGDILTKLDRAAMAASLETRLPFLDVEVITLAWRLPLGLKLRQGRSKWLLRRVLERFVPPALTTRAKAGFAVPIDSWLRGPLRAWAADYLSPARLRRAGLIDAAVVARLWQEHSAGRCNHQHALWAILMFETWYEQWVAGT